MSDEEVFTVTVEHKDGETFEYETTCVPWSWRTWLCVKDLNGRISYTPALQIERWWRN